MPQAVLIFTGVVVFAQMFDVGLRYRSGSGAAFFRDTGLVLRSLTAVLGVFPLAVLTVLWLLDLPPAVALGLVILAAAPGAPLTTRRSEAAGADRDYVAALQVMLAALAMIHMPIVLAAARELGVADMPAIPPEKVAGQVAMVTFLPLVLGWLFQRAAPDVLRARAGLLSAVSKLLFVALMLAVVLALVFLPDLRGKLAIGWPGAITIVVLAALALAAGHFMAGPPDARRGGLATATVARNLGLALYVAESSAETAEAIPAILTYAVLAIVLAATYSRWIRRRIARAGGGV